MHVIARHLRDTGTSQAKFAAQIGVSQPTVSDWLAGKKKPTPENVTRIADVIGRAPEDVLAEIFLGSKP